MKLRELLRDFDWGWYDSNAPENLKYNTQTVRVYDNGTSRYESYFEIGRCTAFNRTEGKLEDFMREDVLNAEVARFGIDDYLQLLYVYIDLKSQDEEVN